MNAKSIVASSFFCIATLSLFVTIPNPGFDLLASTVAQKMFRLPLSVKGIRMVGTRTADFQAISLSNNRFLALSDGTVAWQASDPMLTGSFSSAKIKNPLSAEEGHSQNAPTAKNLLLEKISWNASPTKKGAWIIRASGRTQSGTSIQTGVVWQKGSVRKGSYYFRLAPADLPEAKITFFINRFTRDTEGRMRCIITSGNGGRWTLWGKGGRVLEGIWS